MPDTTPSKPTQKVPRPKLPPSPQRNGQILARGVQVAAAVVATSGEKYVWADCVLAALSGLSALRPRPHRLPLHRFRRGYDRLGWALGRTKAHPRMLDLLIPGARAPLRARRYSPHQGGIRGRLVYFHGGGFVIGSIASHDHFCRFICEACGVEIISVDYSLAPEHPFPAGVEDAIASLEAAAAAADGVTVTAAEDTHGQAPQTSSALGLRAVPLWSSSAVATAPLVVGGDSAGGNLALIAAQQASAGTVQGLWLVYPTVGGSAEMLADLDRLPDSFGLPKETAAWFLETYAPDPTMREAPWMQPGIALDCACLPPTYLGLVERDLLFEGGMAFARRLQALEVEHRADVFPRIPHAFIHMIGVSPASHAAACGLGQGLDWILDRAGLSETEVKV